MLAHFDEAKGVARLDDGALPEVLELGQERSDPLAVLDFINAQHKVVVFYPGVLDGRSVLRFRDHGQGKGSLLPLVELVVALDLQSRPAIDFISILILEKDVDAIIADALHVVGVLPIGGVDVEHGFEVRLEDRAEVSVMPERLEACGVFRGDSTPFQKLGEHLSRSHFMRDQHRSVSGLC